MKITIELEIDIEDSTELLKEECVDNIQELSIVYKSDARKNPQEFIHYWNSPVIIKSLSITE